jgi:trigger factor
LYILEARLGKDYVWGEAADEIMDPEYTKAVAESDIKPVSRPEVDIVRLEAGEEFIFKVKVFVRPEVELGEYKNLGIAEPETLVTEEALTEELEARRRRHAKLINVEEGALEDGDTANLAYTGAVDGEPLSQGNVTELELKIGEEGETNWPGLAEQVKGMVIGEEKEVSVALPAEYQETAFAGREAVLKLKALGATRMELLPLDDEFAKDVSEFDTLEEYKEEIRQNMLAEAQIKNRDNWRNEILKKAVDNVDLPDIPPSMIELKIEEMLADFEMWAYSQGFGRQTNQTTLAALRQEYAKSAPWQVKVDLVYEAIAKQEGFQFGEKEVDAWLAKRYGDRAEEAKQMLQAQGSLDNYISGLEREEAKTFVLRANNFPVEEEDEEFAETEPEPGTATEPEPEMEPVNPEVAGTAAAGAETAETAEEG